MHSNIPGVVGKCKPVHGLSCYIVTILAVNTMCYRCTSTKLPGIVTICSDLREWKFDELQSSHSDHLEERNESMCTDPLN